LLINFALGAKKYIALSAFMQPWRLEIKRMTREHKDKEGVRERKRREMYRRITEVGLKLFSERGYEGTTLDAILPLLCFEGGNHPGLAKIAAG
jgi:hypothetical protein